VAIYHENELSDIVIVSNNVDRCGGFFHLRSERPEVFTIVIFSLVLDITECSCFETHCCETNGVVKLL